MPRSVPRWQRVAAMLTKVRIVTAHREKWRSSELACALADVEKDAKRMVRRYAHFTSDQLDDVLREVEELALKGGGNGTKDV